MKKIPRIYIEDCDLKATFMNKEVYCNMKAVIELDVPEWQIGEDVCIYFPDSMMKLAKCRSLKEQKIATSCKIELTIQQLNALLSKDILSDKWKEVIDNTIYLLSKQKEENENAQSDM